MKWIRLWVEDTLRGTTFTELDVNQRGIWFSLLVMAGDGRNPGIVEMRDAIPWPMDALATYINCTSNELQNALNALTMHNKVHILNDGRICIKNWSKYQTSWEKRKSIGNTVLHATDIDKEGEGEVEEDNTPYSPPFMNFWLEYPKKTGKAPAYAAWKKINPSASLQQKIISALKWQKQSRQWTKDSGEYIPMASTWLNQRRWEDEPDRRIEKEEDFNDPIPQEIKEAISKGWK